MRTLLTLLARRRSSSPAPAGRPPLRTAVDHAATRAAIGRVASSRHRRSARTSASRPSAPPARSAPAQRRGAPRQRLRRHHHHARQRQRRSRSRSSRRPAAATMPTRASCCSWSRSRSSSAANRAEVQDALSAGRRDAPQQPPQHQCARSRYNVTAPTGVRVRAASISGIDHGQGHQGRRVGRVGQRHRAHQQRRADASAPSRSRATSRSPTPTSTAASTRRAPAATCCCAGSRPGSSTLGSISGNVVLDDVECRRRSKRRSSAATCGSAGRWSARAAATSSPRTPATSRSRSAATTGFEVEATSFSGSIRSDFSFALERRHRVAAGGARSAASRRRQRGPRADDLLRQHRHHEALNPPENGRIVGNSGALCIDSRHPPPDPRNSAVLWHSPCSTLGTPGVRRAYNAVLNSGRQASPVRVSRCRSELVVRGLASIDVEEIVAMKKQWVLVCVLAGALTRQRGRGAAQGAEPAAVHRRGPGGADRRHDARQRPSPARRDRRWQAARRPAPIR